MKENSKYKILWVAVGVLLLLNVGLLVWISFFSNSLPAQPKRLFLETELKFDEKQTETYRTLRHEHAQQMRSLRERVKEMKEAYYADLDKSISDDSLRTRANQIESKMAEADVITFKHFQQVRQMCTPAQQRHFDEVILDLIRSIERPGPPGGPHQGGPPPRDGRPPMDDMPPPPER
ncbi:MAG: Spy/CpxP family protein refolding chaperone [Emticicia sp.]|uniref:Spy/CpxP family protein refolding chaperone n=1 Tax=Emticicia sp. TaxID=1930953 RepID=UPI003BA40817